MRTLKTLLLENAPLAEALVPGSEPKFRPRIKAVTKVEPLQIGNISSNDLEFVSGRKWAIKNNLHQCAGKVTLPFDSFLRCFRSGESLPC